MQEGLGKFKIIWIGQTISLFGSSLSTFGLSVWVYQQTGSPSQFGFIIALALIPFILLSPLGGIVADRYDRRMVMFFGDLVTGLSVLCLTILFFSDTIEVWHIFLIVFFGSMGAAFQIPSYLAIVPQMVNKDNYVRANGLVSVSEGISQLIAPAVAGIILSLLGLGIILIVDTFTMLVALCSLWVSRHIPLINEDNLKNIVGSEISISINSFFEALVYLRNKPIILLLIALFSINNFVFGLVETLLAPYMLGLTSPQLYGLVLSVGSTGLLVGSIIITAWNRIKNKILVILFFNGVLGISLTLLGFSSSLIMISMILFVAFFCIPFIDTPAKSLIHDKVPNKMQGRIFSIRNQIEYSGIPLGAAISGVLAEGFFEPSMTISGNLLWYFGWLVGIGPGKGIALLFFLSGILLIVFTIIIYLSKKVRNIEN